jgi:hypothetical protein
MFEILPNPSLETLLLALRGVLLIGAFWVFALAFTRWRRADERDAQRLHAQLERAFGELRSLHETVSVMNARVEAILERVESEARLAPASVAGATRGYELAARFARNGAGVDELVATCGVTRHEAELLVRLHGQQRESTPARAMSEATPRFVEPSSRPAAQSQTARRRGSLLSVVS